MTGARGYCFAVFGRAQAPWRETAAEARADAVDAGYGSMDEHSGTIYLTVPGEIWSTDQDVLILPRSTIKRVRDLEPERRISEARPKRIERIAARREEQLRATG